MLPMRGSIGVRVQSTNISNAARNALVPFSTSSSGFGGGGRGRGGSFFGSGHFNVDERAPGKPNSSEPKSDVTESPIPSPGYGRGGSFYGPRQHFDFNEGVPGKPNSAEAKSETTTETPIPPCGHGHGRGNPISPPSGFPSFSSFMSSMKQPTTGRGRGIGPLAPQTEREDGASPTAEDLRPMASFGDHESDDNKLHGSIREMLSSGMGRGKATKQEDPQAQVIQENRHIRSQRPPGSAASETLRGRRPILSRDDAVKNARNFLSRDDGVDGSGTERERGRGEKGAFSRGRGRGRGMGRGRGFRGRDADEKQDTPSYHADSLHLGDNADGEKLAQKVGPEIMNQLTEEFEEVISRVLPSPVEDEYVEALDINCAVSDQLQISLVILLKNDCKKWKSNFYFVCSLPASR